MIGRRLKTIEYNSDYAVEIQAIQMKTGLWTFTLGFLRNDDDKYPHTYVTSNNEFDAYEYAINAAVDIIDLLGFNVEEPTPLQVVMYNKKIDKHEFYLVTFDGENYSNLRKVDDGD